MLKAAVSGVQFPGCSTLCKAGYQNLVRIRTRGNPIQHKSRESGIACMLSTAVALHNHPNDNSFG